MASPQECPINRDLVEELNNYQRDASPIAAMDILMEFIRKSGKDLNVPDLNEIASLHRLLSAIARTQPH